MRQGTGVREQRTGVTWASARIADICDECFDPIRPGQTVAIYDDEYVRPNQPHGHIKRTYCETCGKLLEDSLTTTEAN